MNPPDPTGTNATLLARLDLTPAVARFIVQRDDPGPPHVAGQYLALGLWVDGRLVQRPYSTASPPSAGPGLEFLIRRVGNGALTPHLWDLRPGDRLRVGPPKGRFTLAEATDRAIIFAATGTGLAPIISMLAALLDRPSGPRPPRLMVVHGVSFVAELAYRERLEGWAATRPGFVYEPAVSRPDDPRNAGWTGARGRLDAVLAGAWQRVGLDARRTVAYLCGNPEAVAAGSTVLTTRGMAAEAVVTERYWTAPAALPGGA